MKPQTRLARLEQLESDLYCTCPNEFSHLSHEELVEGVLKGFEDCTTEAQVLQRFEMLGVKVRLTTEKLEILEMTPCLTCGKRIPGVEANLDA